MAVSNIAGQSLGQQNLLGTVNIISSNQNNGQQGLYSTVSVMSSDQANNPQNSIGAVGGQNVGQKNMLYTVNQVTSSYGPFSQVSELDKRRYHQQLVLLLHAYKCQKRDSTNGEVRGECTLAQCQGMKQVYGHIQMCKVENACTVPNCASSKALILHWKNCTQKECALCFPLKQANARRPQQAPVVQVSQPNQVPNQAVVQRAYSPLGLPLPTSNNSSVIDPGIQSQGLPQSLENDHASPSPSQIVNHIQLPQTSQQQSNVQLRTTLKNNIAVTNTSAPLVFMGDNLQSSENASVKTNTTQMNSFLNQISPLVSSVTGTCAPTNVKDWHQSVTSGLRHHLIRRIIQEVLIVLNKRDINDPNDPTFLKVINYARKNESDMYDFANTREEYYHLLAEKIYKIQRRELTDIRQRRQVATGLGPAASTVSSNPKLPGNATFSQLSLNSANVSAARQRIEVVMHPHALWRRALFFLLLLILSKIIIHFAL